MGLWLLAMPNRPIAARKGRIQSVPGRSGGIWLEEGGHEDVQIETRCMLKDGRDGERVRVWLSGSGWLIFSDEADRAWRAHSVREMGVAAVLEGYGEKIVQIVFDCAPYRYAYPQEEPVVLTAAGNVNNGGSVQSEPRIKVTASGAFTLTVNGCLMEFTGGSVIVDSELRDCLNADGLTLANDRATLGEFPVLAPGNNAVSWTGSVTKVEILRRVRYL